MVAHQTHLREPRGEGKAERLTSKREKSDKADIAFDRENAVGEPLWRQS